MYLAVRGCLFWFKVSEKSRCRCRQGKGGDESSVLFGMVVTRFAAQKVENAYLVRGETLVLIGHPVRWHPHPQEGPHVPQVIPKLLSSAGWLSVGYVAVPGHVPAVKKQLQGAGFMGCESSTVTGSCLHLRVGFPEGTFRTTDNGYLGIELNMISWETMRMKIWRNVAHQGLGDRTSLARPAARLTTTST